MGFLESDTKEVILCVYAIENGTSSNVYQLQNPCLHYFEYPTDPPHDDLRIVYQPETKQVWTLVFDHRYLQMIFMIEFGQAKGYNIYCVTPFFIPFSISNTLTNLQPNHLFNRY